MVVVEAVAVAVVAKVAVVVVAKVAVVVVMAVRKKIIRMSGAINVSIGGILPKIALADQMIRLMLILSLIHI